MGAGDSHDLRRSFLFLADLGQQRSTRMRRRIDDRIADDYERVVIWKLTSQDMSKVIEGSHTDRHGTHRVPFRHRIDRGVLNNALPIQQVLRI